MYAYTIEEVHFIEELQYIHNLAETYHSSDMEGLT